jgi:uncharacterized membrane protein
MALALAYGCALVLFVVIDFVWLSTMTPRFYKPTLGDILLTNVNLKAAAAFYLCYPIGLVIFVIAPALKDGDLRNALIMGALYGLFTYGTYDLTNYATLRNWTAALTVTDMIWGAVLSAAVSCAVVWGLGKVAV